MYEIAQDGFEPYIVCMAMSHALRTKYALPKGVDAACVHANQAIEPRLAKRTGSEGGSIGNLVCQQAD